ncbi:hypothetical protein DFQ30_009234 [Apophysomyces sp. BC1015]|nr:hypothetical protein DFQ30_009234 [Apophysomyces sp. BC1015]
MRFRQRPAHRTRPGCPDPGDAYRCRYRTAQATAHLAARSRDRAARRRHEFHAGAATAGEYDTLNLRAGDDGQVRPPAGGPQKRLGRVPAPPRTLVHVEIADAAVVAAIEIVGGRNARLLRGLTECFENPPFQPLFLDTPFAAGAMPGVTAAVIVLAAPEHRQYRIPAPTRIAAGASPFIVVLALPTHVDHAVDRRRSAEYPAARVDQRAPIQARLSHCLVQPISARIADAIQITDWNMDPVVIVFSACLQQQHPGVGVGREPVRQHTTGCARAHYNVVVLGVQASARILIRQYQSMGLTPLRAVRDRRPRRQPDTRRRAGHADTVQVPCARSSRMEGADSADSAKSRLARAGHAALDLDAARVGAQPAADVIVRRARRHAAQGSRGGPGTVDAGSGQLWSRLEPGARIDLDRRGAASGEAAMGAMT